MKIVVLPIGIRGSGKTTYIEKVAKKNPDVTVFSKDEIVRKKYGRTIFNFQNPGDKSLGGESAHFIREFIRLYLASSAENMQIILDMSIETREYRATFVKECRSLGVDSVVCWYFTTPYNQCIEWFGKKPEKDRIGVGIVDLHMEYNALKLRSTDIDYPESPLYFGLNPVGFNLIRRIDPSDPNQEICFP